MHHRLAIRISPDMATCIGRAFRRPARHMERRRILIGRRRRTVSVVTDLDGQICGATLHCSSADVHELRAWGFDIPLALATDGSRTV